MVIMDVPVIMGMFHFLMAMAIIFMCVILSALEIPEVMMAVMMIMVSVVTTSDNREGKQVRSR